MKTRDWSWIFSGAMLVWLGVFGLCLVDPHPTSLARADTRFISGHVGAGGTGGAWGSWTEASESTLAGDMVYVVIGEAALAIQHEIGEGICAGANLVFSQAGDPAVGGSYRTLDGTDDKFTVTQQWASETIGGASSWTLVMKVRIDAGYDDRDTLAYVGGGGNATLQCDINSDKLYVVLDDKDSGGEGQSSADNITTGSDIYVAIWCDGSANYAGFTSVRPTKWSHFDATKRMTFAGLFNNFDPAAWSGSFFEISTRWLKGRFYYVVAAKECLIDMGS